MKTDVIITKTWEDDFCGKFNIKFKTKLNGEDFIVSGDYFLVEADFVKLCEQCKKQSGEVLFGDKKSNNYCKLTIKQTSNGCKNICYKLVMDADENDMHNGYNIELNTGNIVEPAVLDRILVRLCDFYNEPVNSVISLIYE